MSTVRVFYTNGTTEDISPRYLDQLADRDPRSHGGVELRYTMDYQVTDDWLTVFETKQTRHWVFEDRPEYGPWTEAGWTDWKVEWRTEVARIRPSVWRRVQIV